MARVFQDGPLPPPLTCSRTTSRAASIHTQGRQAQVLGARARSLDQPSEGRPKFGRRQLGWCCTPPVRCPARLGWVDRHTSFFFLGARVGRNVAPGRGDEQTDDQTIRRSDAQTS